MPPKLLGRVLPGPGVFLLLAAGSFAVALWTVGWCRTRWQAVCALAFSPDGKFLAAELYEGDSFNEDFHWCIGDLGQTVELFDSDTGSRGEIVYQTLHRGTWGGLPSTPLGQSICFSPSGETLAVGSWDGTVRLWDARAKKPTDTLRVNFAHVTSVAFSPDGRTLAGCFRSHCTLWDAAPYGEGRRMDTASSITSIAFRPRSDTIILGNEPGGAECWDVSRGERVSTVPGEEYRVCSLQLSPDGHGLAMGGEKSVMVWDFRRGKERFEADEPWVVGVTFSPDGKTLATTGKNGLRFRDAETGEPVHAPVPSVACRSLAYSPDGRLLATGDWDGKVAVWDLGTGTERWHTWLSGPWRFLPVPVLWGAAGMGLLALGWPSGTREDAAGGRG